MKKTKILKIMIACLAIILVVLLVAFTLLFNNPTNKNLRYIYNTEIEGQIGKMPLNVMYSISEYKGSVNQRSIYKALYLLVNETIPKYRNLIMEIEEKGISSYFKENSITIAKELGITEEADFTSFIAEIKKLKADNLALEEYTFHPDTTAKKSGCLETVLLIKYSNNEKIGLYIRIPNKLNENVYAVSCAGGVNKEYLDYEYGSEFVNTNEEGEVVEDIEFTSPGKVL